MLKVFFVISLSLMAHAKNYQCKYKITYQPFPKKEKVLEEIRAANAKALIACKGKNSCSPRNDSSIRVTYNDADPNNFGNPSRIYEKRGNTLDQCAMAAQMACKVVRKGTVFSKTVEASYKGEMLFKRICKHDGSSIEAISRMEPASQPIAKPKPRRGGTTQ